MVLAHPFLWINDSEWAAVSRHRVLVRVILMTRCACVFIAITWRQDGDVRVCL